MKSRQDHKNLRRQKFGVTRYIRTYTLQHALLYDATVLRGEEWS